MGMKTKKGVQVIEHVLAEDALTTLRCSETSPNEFRDGLVRVGRICGYELADRILDTTTTRVKTPVGEAESRVVEYEDTVVISVLRAATPFVEGLVDTFPGVRQGVISASRDESVGAGHEGRVPVDVNYMKIPEIRDADTVIIADPMLATGSTACAVADCVSERSHTDTELAFLSVVSAPEGVNKLNVEHPEITQFTVSLDEGLDKNGYISPGLGDAGDRAFRTE